MSIGTTGSWLNTEIGRYVKGESTQFDGSILADWVAEANAAITAGEPYPYFTPELKRWIFEYLLSIA